VVAASGNDRVIQRFLVSGQVQGVGYRWFVARHARDLGLAGYARNLADGRVEVVIRGGDESALARFEQILRRGPANADVSEVAREDAADDSHVPTRSFDIR
jgi:acylphosphatase